MNPELLTCRKLTAGIIYPAISVQPSDMNRFYAEITEKYAYQSLQHLPDGIRMANPNGDCFVQLGRTQVNEDVMYFQASKEKCLDIFNAATRRFNINQLLSFGVKLTAFLPMSGPDASSEFLESHLFGLKPRQWAALGDGRRGAGMRVVLQQEGVLDLRIEPFYGDTSELYVEVDLQYPQPIANLSELGVRMDFAYEYMFSNVKAFLTSLK